MTFQLQPLGGHQLTGRNTTIANHIFNLLRRAIVTMKLLPGNSLSEAEIAKQLGVSRQPVREAFIQLAKIGLLSIRPQRGSFVVKISRPDVDSARFIREAIELAIVEKACEQAQEHDINEINALITRQEVAVVAGDQEHFLDLDDSFHCAIAAGARCLYGWHIVENLKAQMDRVRFLSLPEATPILKIVEQHRRIAAAIAKRDKRGAREALSKHLAEIQYSLPHLAERYSDMFTVESNLPG